MSLSTLCCSSQKPLWPIPGMQLTIQIISYCRLNATADRIFRGAHKCMGSLLMGLCPIWSGTQFLGHVTHRLVVGAQEPYQLCPKRLRRPGTTPLLGLGGQRCFIAARVPSSGVIRPVSPPRRSRCGARTSGHRLSASTRGMGLRHPPWSRCVCIWRPRDPPNISFQRTCNTGR